MNHIEWYLGLSLCLYLVIDIQYWDELNEGLTKGKYSLCSSNSTSSRMDVGDQLMDKFNCLNDKDSCLDFVEYGKNLFLFDRSTHLKIGPWGT